jgi:hypothetical protein
MADDGVQVKISADGGPAKASMQDTSTSISASLEGIKSALENFGTKNKSVVNEAIQNNANLSRSFIEMKDSATGGFNVVTGVIERFRGVLGTLATAIAGGFLFTKSIEQMLKFEDSVRGLQIVFGMTAEKATSMSVALRLAGISSETFEGMAFKVGRTLKSNSEEFTRLGVVTTDASGKLLPMDQILQNVYKRMLDFKAGTDQNLFALTAVGRSAKDFSSDMERLNTVTERAAIVQARLGIEMGPDRIAAIERYRVDLNEFKIVLETIGEKIGAEVLPRLQGMAQWFNEYGPAAIKVIIDIVKGFISVLQVLGTSIAVMAIKATGAFETMAVSARVVGAVLKAQVTGDWAGVVDAVSEASGKIAKINANTAEEVELAWAQSIAKIENLWKEAGTAEYWGGEAKRGMKPPVTGKGNEDFTFKPPKTTGGDDKMAGLEEQLKAQEDAYNNMKESQGSYEVWSLQMTENYWAKVLVTENLTAKERIEVQTKYYDAKRTIEQKGFAAHIASMEVERAAMKDNLPAQLEMLDKELADILQHNGAESAAYEETARKIVEIKQKMVDEKKKIAEIELKSEEAGYTHQIEMAKLNADQQVALGKMSNTQRLALETDFENQMYQKQLAAMQKQLATLTLGTEAYATMYAKILAMENTHELAMTKLANQGVLDREQYALQADKVIDSSFSTLLSDLADRTKTIKQTFLDFFKSISDGLAKIAANQVAQQFLGGGTQGGNFISSITSKIFGGAGAGAGAAGAATDTAHTAAVTADTTATTLQTTATTAQVTIGTTLTASFTALVAAANAAAAAMSAMGAQGAGSALGGLGGGFGDIIPSFAVGTPYVPQDSLAFVHRGEAIVPAKYNSGAGRGMFQANHFHFNITGNPDTRTMSQIEHAAARGQNRASVRAGS